MRRLLQVAAMLLVPGGLVVGASRPAVEFSHSVVVSVDALASQAGAEILSQGGNAADAAVATALALAVVYPEAGNLGGGHFSLWRDAQGDVEVMDARETAPLKATAKMFMGEDGKLRPGSSLFSPDAIAVPGTVAGLGLLHHRHGRLPWKATVAPALRLAAQGFRVSRRLASDLRRRQERLGRDPAAAAVFYASGRPPEEGDLLVQSDLAWSLRAIMEEGPEAFGRGRLAARLAADLAGRGARVTALDLAEYRPVLRRPIRTVYRGWDVFTPPPPSAGGMAVAQILRTLSPYHFQPEDAGGSRLIHLVAETLRRAFADRQKWLADPDFVDVPLNHLLDSVYLQSWNASISLDRSTPASELFPPPADSGREQPDADGQTTHFSVVDQWGQAVSQTTTLNAFFGSGLMAAGTGILWNNEMDDFASAPGQPNLYLLPGAVPNAIAPGKRPLSSM
ncbi:MAG: gamma-glutamyltransferase, partial [Acidobacteriota bacterium]